MPQNWLSLEHQIYRLFQNPLNLKGKSFLLALSGGVDSVALLAVFSALKLKFSAAYVHHGGENPYRQQAGEFVAQECLKLKVPFYLLGPAQFELKSEEEMRDFRYEKLRELKVKLEHDFLVTAHHADDQLETRLLRLIRGTSAQGLQAMKWMDQDLLRPFLSLSREEIEAYVSEKKLGFLQDPSNENTDYLRNWMRREWLPLLEKQSKGAVQSMARSLEIISAEKQDSLLPGDLWHDEHSLSRPCFLSLSQVDQRQALAQLLLKRGQREFSYAQLIEVQKHLDNSQKELRFRVAKCDWSVNAEQISLL